MHNFKLKMLLHIQTAYTLLTVLTWHVAKTKNIWCQKQMSHQNGDQKRK